MATSMQSIQSETHSDSSIEIDIRSRLLGTANQSSASEAADFQLDVNLNLPGKGITAIFGASGSGKTTLLRCIAGLQAVDAGSITINGDTWHDSAVSLPAHQRAVGYVFQEASLFSYLTVEGNLQFAIKRAEKVQSGVDTEQVIALMGIDNLLARKPAQLSGGERQRVAIARALLINPRLLLMDEPLAALDAQRRAEILPYLERLHQEIAMPVLYVTHSLDEVTRLADYLVLLEQGRVLAQGELIEMLARTDLSFGAEQEVGAVLEGTITRRDDQWHLATVAFAGGELVVRDSQGLGEIGKSVRVRVLARDISLSLDEAQRSSILNRLPATIESITATADPAMATLQLQVGENLLLARVSQKSVSELQLQPKQQVWAQIKSVAILR